MIFWFLAGFSLLLIVAVVGWLPETHPPQARLKVSPRILLRDYVGIARNPRFLRLAAAGSLSRRPSGASARRSVARAVPSGR